MSTLDESQVEPAEPQRRLPVNSISKLLVSMCFMFEGFYGSTSFQNVLSDGQSPYRVFVLVLDVLIIVTRQLIVVL